MIADSMNTRDKFAFCISSRRGPVFKLRDRVYVVAAGLAAVPLGVHQLGEPGCERRAAVVDDFVAGDQVLQAVQVAVADRSEENQQLVNDRAVVDRAGLFFILVMRAAICGLCLSMGDFFSRVKIESRGTVCNPRLHTWNIPAGEPANRSPAATTSRPSGRPNTDYIAEFSPSGSFLEPDTLPPSKLARKYCVGVTAWPGPGARKIPAPRVSAWCKE